MIIYYDENKNLIASTDDYIPSISEIIKLNDCNYEVVDKKIEIKNSFTEISIFLNLKNDGEIYG